MKLTKLEQAMYEKAVEDMELCCTGDPEADHVGADEIIEKVLEDLGLSDLSYAYTKALQDAWYA